MLEYAYDLKDSTTANENLINLIIKMLDYGTASQINFNYNTNKLANSQYYKINVENGYLEDGFTYGRYQFNELVTINAEERLNYNFSCWIDSNGNIVSSDETLTFNV